MICEIFVSGNTWSHNVGITEERFRESLSQIKSSDPEAQLNNTIKTELL